MSNDFASFLKVGLIATRFDSASAYYYRTQPPMSKLEQYESRRELREGLRQLSRCVPDDSPEIILCPELASPRPFIKELRQHSKALGAMIISGVDYYLDYKNKTAKNEICLLIPDKWPAKTHNKGIYQFSIYKSNASKKENTLLKKAGWSFTSDSRLWIFDAGKHGKFGIANCYDFLDVELHMLYRTNIQHLFVLSYNKDVTSFIHTAESLCRTLYCNVVICNSGFYGGSVVVSPYKDTFKRLIFKHEGNNLFLSQVVKLPVKKLINVQRGMESKDMKSLPPGFSKLNLE